MSVQPAGASLLAPRSLEEALDSLAGAAVQPLAGGTDVYPGLVGRALGRPLLDLSRLGDLRGIGPKQSADGTQWLRIGALETWTALREASLPPGLEALAQAAAEVGGRQVQNLGTLGGNLCNASPAADGIPALLALDAQLELRSRQGSRRISVGDFVLGNRRTALAPGELLVAIDVPLKSPSSGSSFLKLGHRRFLVISIAMAAVQVDLDTAGRISHCAVAVGACSAAARRLSTLEARVTGLAPDQAPASVANWMQSERVVLLSPLAPIDDVRGTSGYRLDAVAELIPRALLLALSESISRGHRS